MKKFLSEFKQFAMKSDMIQLAVGVILGTAVNSVVKSLTSDIFMPIIGIFVGKINIASLAITIGSEEGNAVQIKYGSFLQAVLDFIITAFCIFIMVKLIKKLSEFSLEKVKEVVKTEILKTDDGDNKDKIEDEKNPQSKEVEEAPQSYVPEETNKLLGEIRDLLKQQSELSSKTKNSFDENK